MQYSIFAVEASDFELNDLLIGIKARIDERVDDVRAYHVPARCEIFHFGQQSMPAGITVGSVTVGKLLARDATAGHFYSDEFSSNI